MQVWRITAKVPYRFVIPVFWNTHVVNGAANIYAGGVWIQNAKVFGEFAT